MCKTIIKLLVFSMLFTILTNCGKKVESIEVKLTFYIGDVSVIRDGNIRIAKLGMNLTAGDILKTGTRSEARVLFKDIGICRLKENTEVKVEELIKKAEQNKSKMMLSAGRIIVILKKLSEDSEFNIHTPTAVAGVRGTTFILNVERGRETTTKLAVLSGRVEFQSVKEPEKIVKIEHLKEATLPGDNFEKLEIKNISTNSVQEIEKLSKTEEVEKYQFESIKEEVEKAKGEFNKISTEKEVNW